MNTQEQKNTLTLEDFKRSFVKILKTHYKTQLLLMLITEIINILGFASLILITQFQLFHLTLITGVIFSFIPLALFFYSYLNELKKEKHIFNFTIEKIVFAIFIFYLIFNQKMNFHSHYYIDIIMCGILSCYMMFYYVDCLYAKDVYSLFNKLKNKNNKKYFLVSFIKENKLPLDLLKSYVYRMNKININFEKIDKIVLSMLEQELIDQKEADVVLKAKKEEKKLFLSFLLIYCENKKYH